MRSRRAPGARLHALSARERRRFSRSGTGGLSCPDAAVCAPSSAPAALAGRAAARRRPSAGTLDSLPDAQIAERFAPRLVLHPEERYAPTSADELLALGATLVRRDGSLARAAPLTPATAARREQLRRRTAVRVGAAPRLRARREQAVPGARRRAAPDVRPRRAAPPGQGQRAGLARAAGLAHALSRARGRRAVLALLARRRLALDAARRHAARRAQGAAAGDPPAPRGRLGGGHGRALGRPAAVRRLERALRRRVAAVRGRDARRRRGRRAHAPGLVDRARIARQPAGAGDRATALVALRPARGDVRAPARRGARSAPSRPSPSATASTTRSGSSTARAAAPRRRSRSRSSTA